MNIYVQSLDVIQEIIPRLDAGIRCILIMYGFCIPFFIPMGGDTLLVMKAMYVDMKIMTDILQQQFDENIFARSMRQLRSLVSNKRMIVFPRTNQCFQQRFNNLVAFQYRHRVQLLYCDRTYS